jgi:hypothetical protein
LAKLLQVRFFLLLFNFNIIFLNLLVNIIFFIGVYTIEFQKRGLPHSHILLWLDEEDKLESPESINSVISAELPDPGKFPKLYSAVCKFMIHGPCCIPGVYSPCVKNKQCSKYFPKKFISRTSFDESGYPIYRRRDLGVTV